MKEENLWKYLSVNIKPPKFDGLVDVFILRCGDKIY